MPYDNAAAGTLKNELTDHRSFIAIENARRHLFDYIELS